MFGIIEKGDALEHSETLLGSLISIRSCGTVDYSGEKTTNRLDGWPEYMLAFVESGELIINIENKTIRVLENEVAIIPPNIPYSFKISYGTTYHWMHFFGSGIIDHFELHDYLYHLSDPSEFLLYLKKLPLDAIDNHELKKDICSINGMQIIASLKKSVCPSLIENTPVSILSSSFRTEVSVAEYAKTAGMTEAEFSNSIKSETGLTPKQFIIYKRINEAKLLLSTKNGPISAVTEHVGYFDYQYFARIFKKHTGLTPTEYRNCFSK